jgi:hypothetical protein
MKLVLLLDQPHVAPTLRDHAASNATRVTRLYCEGHGLQDRKRLR